MSILLGVNIDHVATLREVRGTTYPDPVLAAALAEQAGADGITVHLREDRRHIQDRDIKILSETLQTRMNFEMAATPDMLKFAKQILPAHCCIVPEKRQELTTEGGLDVIGQQAMLADFCGELATAGIQVSLFIDPDPAQIAAAAALKVPVIEIHTGAYAEQHGDAQQHELHRVIKAAGYAHELGLQVNAGHGLHYHNVQAIAAIDNMVELNIGHAIIARAIMTGLPEAVSTMKRIISEAALR